MAIATNLSNDTAIADSEHRWHVSKSAKSVVGNAVVRCEAILESSLDCIITLDDQERVIGFNPAAEMTFGYSRSDAVGKALVELIVPQSSGSQTLGLVQCLTNGIDSLLDKRHEMM